jgi:hypothetical protein
MNKSGHSLLALLVLAAQRIPQRIQLPGTAPPMNKARRRQRVFLVITLLILGLPWTAQPAQGQSGQLFLPLLPGSAEQPLVVRWPDGEDSADADPSAPRVAVAATADPATVWQEGFEDLSFDGGVTITGLAWPTLSTRAHTGRYGAALCVLGANGLVVPTAVRLTYNARGRAQPDDPNNLPDEAYYSAYYYLPQTIVTEWWNLMQWKRSALLSDGNQTRRMTYSLSGAYAQGNLYLTLRSRVNEQGQFVEPGKILAVAPQPLPIGSWVQLECFYRWAKTPTGRITCWQNGTQLWDIENVITEFDTEYRSYPRQWTVNNEIGLSSPTNHVVFVDDFAVRTQPLGAP